MSDAYTYTKVLGSARQPLDIIDVSQILTFTSSLVSRIDKLTVKFCDIQVRICTMHIWVSDHAKQSHSNQPVLRGQAKEVHMPAV